MLDRELRLSRRSFRPVSLLMLDLDHFKSVNDRYGHMVGDEVLAEMARRIQSNLRAEDIFARYGGEEFAIIVAESCSKQAVVVAERCRLAICSEPFSTTAGQIECSISIGFAITDEEHPLEMEELMQEADQELYKAKENGRNQVSGQK